MHISILLLLDVRSCPYSTKHILQYQLAESGKVQARGIECCCQYLSRGGGLQAQQEIAGALQEAAVIKGRAESLMKDTEEQLAGAGQQQAELDQRQQKMAEELEDLSQRQVSNKYCTPGSVLWNEHAQPPLSWG